LKIGLARAARQRAPHSTRLYEGRFSNVTCLQATAKTCSEGLSFAANRATQLSTDHIDYVL
jgi:hypothetical protein